MNATADLRAGANECVTVDQRAFIDVRAHVDVHRRHADHSGSYVGAVPDRRAARDDTHPVGEGRGPHGIGVFVEEPERAVGRKVGERAHPETKQDPLLDPRLGLPRAPRVARSRAYFAA